MFNPEKRAELLRPRMMKDGKYFISKIEGSGEEREKDEKRITYSTYFKFKWYIDIPEILSLPVEELWSSKLIGLVENPLTVRLRDIKKLEFQNPPYSAAYRLKGKLGNPKNYSRAFVIQAAGCDYSCVFCYVPPEINASMPNFGKYFSVKEIIDYFLKARKKFEEPINVIRISGGEVPTIIPEMILDVYSEMEKIEESYLWIDTNLSTTKYLEKLESDLKDIMQRKNVGVVGCFKGVSKEDFSKITGADSQFYENQFETAKLLLDWKTDFYVYLPALIYENNIERKTKSFIERLQELNKNLPLRAEVLIIKEYPGAVRNIQIKAKEGRSMPKIDQRIFFDLWYNKLLQQYYPKELLEKFCCEISL